MNTQQKKLLAIAAVVLFHGAVITVMLAQHGCKSDGSKPSSAETPAPVQPTPVVTPPSSLTASNNGFVEPTRPAPETPVSPVPVAQFAEPLPAATPTTGVGSATTAPAASGPTVTWVVSSGENPIKIAQKNGITLDELIAANPPMTRATIIHPGQSLNIPSHKSTAATSTPVAADSGNTYKAVKGDSLSKIASKYHTTAKALQELNGLPSQNIREGQVLKVPEMGASSTSTAPDASATAAASTSANDGNTYVVKSGDTLDKIAHTLHVSASELMSLNGLTAATARSLRAGRTLKLPADAQTPASSAPAPTPVSAVPASSPPPPVTMGVTAVPQSGSGAPPVTPVQ